MSDDSYGVSMDEAGIGERLAAKGDGVLSFGGDPGYAIPVSFGYDAPNRRLVFQFVFPSDSRKRDYVDAPAEVSLVSYEWNGPDDWWSVIVTGDLTPVPDAEEAAAAAVFAEFATPVSTTVFDRPLQELEPEWYQLDVAALDGRRSPLADD